MNLQERNKKIINAVIRKAEACCPDSLAAIGIYGSFVREDYNEQSDLDLLILINDDRGWQLAAGFIQDDIKVGHDIYCTSWESLEEEATYVNPNISKLLDSEMVYFADTKYAERLNKLRNEVREIMASPFTLEDYKKAEKFLKESKIFYANAMLAETEADTNRWAGNMIYALQNALMLLNKDYFKKGMKNCCDELDTLKYKPDHVGQLFKNVVEAGPENITIQMSILLSECEMVFEQVKMNLMDAKQKPGPDNITGTYEEFYSNWRSKMYHAAKEGNTYLSFMSLTNAMEMFKEIEGEIDIKPFELLEGFDSNDLQKNADHYEQFLTHYLDEYHKAGMEGKHFKNVDEFVEEYLKDCDGI